jgi:HSP20 family protein
MIYRTHYPQGLFSELERLQRDVQQAFGLSPNIRGAVGRAFPAINIGHTSDSVELYAFLPGVDPKEIELHMEQGVLVVAGQRKVERPTSQERSIVHIDERFSGRFRRVVTLPAAQDHYSVRRTDHGRNRQQSPGLSIRRNA